MHSNILSVSVFDSVCPCTSQLIYSDGHKKMEIVSKRASKQRDGASRIFFEIIYRGDIVATKSELRK